MFVFLTRLGRLFVATVVLGGVISILGVMSITGVLVSHHQNASATAGCSVSMGTVINGQQRLLVNGSGLTPSSNYVYGQTGVQTAMVTTNSSGAFSDQSLFYHGAGAYRISVDYYYWSNNKLVEAVVTSCSATL